jgi:glutaredoxin 3
VRTKTIEENLMTEKNTLRLFNIDGCGYCRMVRDVLKSLNIEYEKIDVPWAHHSREEVYEVSGQYTVPVLVDGDVVLSDEYEIIDYLKKRFSS